MLSNGPSEVLIRCVGKEIVLIYPNGPNVLISVLWQETRISEEKYVRMEQFGMVHFEGGRDCKSRGSSGNPGERKEMGFPYSFQKECNPAYTLILVQKKTDFGLLPHPLHPPAVRELIIV